MKVKETGKWSRLDNAAKIFPPTTTKRDTKVFRFACELKEMVEQEILQQAVTLTLEDFPAFRCVLKNGLFWYYLEESDIQPVVREEYRPPCSPIYNKNVKRLLFEVTYYRKRVNLEVYHALTDGTGAMEFLRMMVFHYLVLKYADEFADNPPVLDYDATSAERTKDSFQKYYSRRRKRKQKMLVAYRMRGPRFPEQRILVTEGIMPVHQLLQKAREYHTTLTILCVSLLIMAIRKEMPVRAAKKPVVITVPVNLRNHFPSGSARNFFCVIRVSYGAQDGDGSLESILAKVGANFKQALAPEELEGSINQFTALEKNVFTRAIPLVLKDPVMRVGYELSAREESSSLSNVGPVRMPPELSKYIELFDVFVSANKPQICMCSFGENLTMSFTSPFVGTDVQKNFFRAITELGVTVKIAANRIDEEAGGVL